MPHPAPDNQHAAPPLTVPVGSAARWAAAFLAVIESQSAFVVQLESLAASQRQAIDAGDPSALASLVARRESVVASLVRADASCAPYRSAWSRVAPQLSPQVRDTLERRVKDVADAVDRVLRADKDDLVSMRSTRDGLARHAQVTARGAGAVAAYGARPPVEPRYKDEQG